MNLKDLKQKTLAAHTQPYKFIQAANPDTILDLIQTVEEMRNALSVFIIRSAYSRPDQCIEFVEEALKKFNERFE